MSRLESLLLPGRDKKSKNSPKHPSFLILVELFYHLSRKRMKFSGQKTRHYKSVEDTTRSRLTSVQLPLCARCPIMIKCDIFNYVVVIIVYSVILMCFRFGTNGARTKKNLLGIIGVIRGYNCNKTSYAQAICVILSSRNAENDKIQWASLGWLKLSVTCGECVFLYPFITRIFRHFVRKIYNIQIQMVINIHGLPKRNSSKQQKQQRRDQNERTAFKWRSFSRKKKTTEAN